jgi:hypothetical protein
MSSLSISCMCILETLFGHWSSAALCKRMQRRPTNHSFADTCSASAPLMPHWRYSEPHCKITRKVTIGCRKTTAAWMALKPLYQARSKGHYYWWAAISWPSALRPDQSLIFGGTVLRRWIHFMSHTSIQFRRLCILLLWIVNPFLSFGARPVGPSAVI